MNKNTINLIQVQDDKNTNQSKLTPTLDRNTDRGGTITWEQLQSNNNCL